MSFNDIWYGAPKPVRALGIIGGIALGAYAIFYAATGYVNPIQYFKDKEADGPATDEEREDAIIFGEATNLNNAGKAFIETQLNETVATITEEETYSSEDDYVINNIFEQYQGPIVNDDGSLTYDYIPRGWDHIPEQDEYVPPEADLPEDEAENFVDISENESEEPEDEIPYEDETYVEPITNYGDEPYPIGFQEFDTEHPEYDKLSVVYFAGDGVLADDQNNELDISQTIGEELVYEMNESKNRDFFYARNEKTQTDYEVQKVSITSIERLFGIA